MFKMTRRIIFIKKKIFIYFIFFTFGQQCLIIYPENTLNITFFFLKIGFLSTVCHEIYLNDIINFLSINIIILVSYLGTSKRKTIET